MTRVPVQYAYMRLGLGRSQDEWLTDTIWVDAPQESGQWGELCAWADVVAHDHFRSMGRPDCVYGFLDYVAGVSAFGDGPHDDGSYDFERDGGRMALGMHRRAGAFAPEEVVENLARDITRMIQNGEFELFDKASGWDDDNLRDVGYHAIDNDIDEYGSYDETDLLDRAILRIDRSTLKVSMTVAPDDVIDIFVDEAEYRIRNGIVHLVDDGRGWTEPALREIVYDIWDEDADFYDGSGYDAEDIVSRSVDALLEIVGGSTKGAMAAKHHKKAGKFVGAVQWEADEGYSGNPTARVSNYAVVVMTPDDTGDGTWGYQVFDEEDDDAMRYGYAFRIQYGFESEREVKEFVDKVLLLP